MKKLIYIFTSLILLSCVGAGGFDEQEGTDPLAECVLSSTAEAGGEAIIQWNGFSEDVTVSLVSSDGEAYDMVVDVVTASGLVFMIPEDLPAGVYKVKVSMAGKVSELGEMEITASQKKPGDEGDSEKEPEKEPEDDSEQNPDAGDGSEENPGDSEDEGSGEEPGEEPGDNQEPETDPQPGEDPGQGDEPETPSGPKTLKRIEYYSPYSAGSQFMRAWDIDRSSSPVLRVSEYVVDNSGATLSGYDEYSGNGSGYFKLKKDGLEISNHVEMTYLLGSGNKVTGGDVLVYGKKETTRYTWEYDSQQRLSEISYVHSTKGEVALATLSYEGNCLTGFDGIVYEYGNSSLVNAEDAADVVWAYMTVSKAHTDPALFVPYLMGWYDVKSTSLPTKMLLPASSGSGTVTCNFSYEFDKQGYVKTMGWKEGNSNLKIVYVYE